MIAYLSEDTHTHPAVAPVATEDVPARSGLVTCGITHGEVFLFRGNHANRRHLRLAWTAEDEQRDRVVPGGRWNILGYRLLATDEAGVEWMISTTSHGRKTMVVRPGRRTVLRAAEGMDLRFRMVREGSDCRINMAFISTLGPFRGGITLYRDGSRMPMKYRVVDADGELLASGNMAYG